MSADQHILNAHRAMLATADTLSAGAILASFTGWLPPLAALVAVLWYIIQMWESETVRGWLHRHNIVKRRRSRNKRRSHHKVHPPETGA